MFDIFCDYPFFNSITHTIYSNFVVAVYKNNIIMCILLLNFFLVDYNYIIIQSCHIIIVYYKE